MDSLTLTLLSPFIPVSVRPERSEAKSKDAKRGRSTRACSPDRPGVPHGKPHGPGRRWRLACLAVLVALHAAGPAGWTADDAPKPAPGRAAPDRESPLVITADRMELRRKENLIVYRGNVLAERGDVKIQSDVLSARYDPGDGALKTVVAEGKVRVSQGAREMTGDKAVFDDSNETITVSGNTVMRDGDNSVSGGRVTIYLKEDRSVVENRGGRVKAVIFPGQWNR